MVTYLRKATRIFSNRFAAINLFLALALSITLSPIDLLAQSFYLQVYPKAGTLDDVFQMSVVIEGSRNSGHPVLSGGDDFKLTYIGPRSEVSIVNGAMSSKQTYQYTLIPTREGELESPSAEVEINGQRFLAKPVKVKVSNSEQTSAAQRSQNVFLKQSVDNNIAYQGQQIVNTIELYSKIRLYQPQMDDLSYDDFWSQPIGKDETIQRLIDGSNFSITRLKRAIFPQKSGELIIPERRARAKVLINTPKRSPLGSIDPFSDDFFTGFFGTSTYEEKSLRSNALKIDVKPLPPPPPGLPLWNTSAPLVGATKLEAQMSTDPIKLGESKTLTIKVLTQGNSAPLGKPDLNLDSSVKVYDESPETDYIEGQDQLTSKKTYRFSLVPTDPGKISLQNIRLGFFDPSSGQWKSATIGPISFDVLSSPETEKSALGKDTVAPKNLETSEPSTQQSANRKVQTDKTSGAEQGLPRAESPTQKYEELSSLEKLSKQISSGLAILIASTLAVVALAMVLAIRAGKSRKARSLRQQSILSSTDARTLSEAFCQIVSSQLHVSESISGEAFKASLRQNLSDSASAYRIISLMDEIEALRFGPENSNNKELDRLKAEAIECLRLLD